MGRGDWGHSVERGDIIVGEREKEQRVAESGHCYNRQTNKA